MTIPGLSSELHAIGIALGLLDDQGGFETDWFADPLAHVRQILTSATQRGALLDAIDGLLPAASDGAGTPGESWHPLIASDTPAQLYITLVRDPTGEVALGLAGRVHGHAGIVTADVAFQAPLIHAGSAGLTSVIGTAAAPLRLTLGLTFDDNQLGFDDISVDVRVSPLAQPAATADVSIGVGVREADGTVTQASLDPQHFAADALSLVATLLEHHLGVLAQAPGMPPELAALATHLLPAVGLGAGVPALPIERIGADADLLRTWLSELLAAPAPGGQPPIDVWLGHVAGLFGAPAPTGSGSDADPWAIQLAALGTGGAELTLATRTMTGGSQEFLIGLRLNLDAPSVRARVAATLLALPLTGTAPPAVLPSASADVVAPRDPAANLISGTTLGVGSLRGGVSWNGSALSPRLEMVNVQFDGTTYPIVDLSSIDSARAAAASAVRDALTAALGDTGPGRQLAALAGVLAPETDAVSPVADPAALVSAPTREIARVHRAVLTDPTRGWKHMLEALAALLGLTGAASGTGTEDDPWRVEIATAGPIELDLAAWTRSEEPAPLRIGLRAGATPGPLTVWWLAELIAADLPNGAPATIGLMAGQHARLALGSPATLAPLQGIAVGIQSAEARVDWTPGQRLQPLVRFGGISLSAGPEQITLPQLALPPSGFDPTLPDLGLGVPAADLLAATRILLSRLAASWAGAPGFTLAGLLGLHGQLPGLPSEWPLIAPLGGGGLNVLLSDPLGVLRDWLGRIATELSADGTPFALHLLSWLKAWLQASLPTLDAPEFGAMELDVGGAGTYADPWRVDLTDAGSTQLLAWLEPDGPPTSWAAAIPGLVFAQPTASSLLAFAARLTGIAPALRGTFADPQIDSLGDALGVIDGEIAAGDGVVPLTAAVPDSPSWTRAGTLVDAAHHLLPSHPDAIAQIISQLDAWQPMADRAALFVGPPFADSTAWAGLLAAAGGTAPDAHFDLRPAPDPTVANLGAVSAQVAHYTANLVDTGGDLTAVTAQIGAVVDRIRQLRSKAPVVLVAHSTAGLAARAFAAANPTLVRGLITLGTPHGPAPLSALSAPEGGEALRAVGRLLAAAGSSNSLVDAVAHLGDVLDGWTPGAAGQPATALSYPLARFRGGADVSAGGVPALAIAGQLSSGLLDTARAAVGVVAHGGTLGTPPTHLAFGLRAALAVPPAAAGEVAVNAGVRIDAFRVRLVGGAAEPTRPATRLDVEILLDRPGDWLVAMPPARVRRAELGLTVEMAAGATAPTAVPRARLYDAALAAPALPVVELGDGMFEGLLDAVLAALATAGVPPGAPTDTPQAPGVALADALQALGLVIRDAAGRAGVSADALTALRADATAFLEPRLQAALEGTAGLLGITGPPGGPWQLSIAGAPLTVEVTRDPWRLALQTGSGLALGADLNLSAAVALTLPAMQPSITAGLTRSGLALTFSSDAKTLSLTPGAGRAPVAIAPATGGLAASLAEPLLEAVASAIAAAGLEHALGPGWSVGSSAAAVRDPGAWLRSTGALGDGIDIVGDRVQALLSALSTAAGDTHPSGLKLPEGFVVTAAGTPCTITLATAPPMAIPGPAGTGTLAVALSGTIDRRGHITPGGKLTVDIPLAATWGGVAVSFGFDAGAVSLSVTPRPPGGGPPLAPIVLLPRFAGLGPLAADAAQALLPAALDAVVAQLPAPLPAVAQATLAVADALGIHGGTGDPTFAAHGPQLQTLAASGSLESLAASGLPGAVVALWHAAALPGAVTAAGNGVQWSGSVAGGTGGVRVGWASDLAVTVSIDGITAGPMQVTHLAAGFSAGAPTAELDVAVALPAAAQTVLGVQFAPQLTVGLAAGALTAALVPLGAGTAATLAINLLPDPALVIGPNGPAALIENWALPLAANAVINLLDLAGTHVWTGGPTLHDVLTTIGLMEAGGHVVVPLPAPADLLLRAVATLAASPASLKVTDDLQLQLVLDNTRTPPLLGAGLQGHIDLPAGSVAASIRFGESTPTWIPDPPPALRLLLVESSTFALRPELRLAPFGVRVTGADGKPLLDGQQVHLGAVAAYGWANFVLAQESVTASGLGAAVDLDDVGLPLSGATGASNPVAASLVGSDRDTGAPTDGDEQSLAPGLGLVAFRRPDASFSLLRLENDAPVPFDEHPLWIGIHRNFGPLTIDQIGFAYMSNAPRSVAVLVDGGVSAGGLTIQADELGVVAPLGALASPAQWQLELRGLAVGMDAGPVTLAGGLLERPGHPIDYTGIVNVQVAGKGFSAVGAYARPSDAAGPYTSLFVFVALPFVIGGPPYLFVTGLGGGAGYNRRLIVPADVTAVDSFPLVTAIDGGLADDPMTALDQLGTNMPPRRGSLWLAAGVRFTSFALVETTAVAYVALDRGLQIGILGLSRAEIPVAAPLAAVELAIKARFSSQEGVLSVQAQLTDHSWLLSRDCQLTGGFAFFVWFHRGQFVLTLGGYHPAFSKPPEFPIVPRLGFHWAVGAGVTIKGESYFALTSSCVMAGGRLEASYDNDGIQASFTVYADFLISWDPFHYDISAGVSVSAGFHIQVCFIACVTVDVSISLSATVHILGPPLHGEATLDLDVCSVTVQFGDNPAAPPKFLSWPDFRAKYVVAGAADGSVVSAHAGPGLLAPESGQGAGHPGSAPTDPWRFVGDFTLSTETRMPSTSYAVTGATGLPPLNEVDSTLDLAPMNVSGVTAAHAVTITAQDGHAVDMTRLTITPAVGRVPAAVWRLVDHPVADATLRNACTGMSIRGAAQPVVDAQWTSGVPPIIPIGQLIDESTHVPLGLTTPAPAPPSPPAPPAPPAAPVLTGLATAGAAGAALIGAAADLLGPGGAAARAATGLPAAGATARSLSSLRHRRSSPPVVVALGVVPDAPPASPPGPAVPARPPQATDGGPMPPVPLLRAILRGPMPAGAPAAVMTSASGAELPRVRAPAAPDRPLRRIEAPRIRAVRLGRSIRAPLPQAQPNGADVAAGSLHVWDLPLRGGAVLLSGDAAARAVFVDRAGAPVSDVEAVPGAQLRLTIPAAASRLAVTCLGMIPEGLQITPGPGAVALGGAPRGRICAVGWQDAMLLARVAPAALLARGATLRLGAPVRGRGGLPSLVSGTRALAGQTASETIMPTAVDVVLVILDARGSVLPAAGPRVLATGATLSTPPQVVAGGRRLHLFYSVGDRQGPLLRVAVSASGWQTAGVLGLRGRAEEWATMLGSTAPRQFVPVGPLTASGGVTVNFELSGEAP
jgi:hypothetical protein